MNTRRYEPHSGIQEKVNLEMSYNPMPLPLSLQGEGLSQEEHFCYVYNISVWLVSLEKS